MSPFKKNVASLAGKWIKPSAALLALVAIAGCETSPSNWRSESAGSVLTSPPATSPTASTNSAQATAQTTTAINSTQPEAQIFSGQPVTLASPHGSKRASAARARHTPTGNGDITLSFADTPVQDVVQIILGDHLGKNFSVDADVQGAITLNNQSGLETRDLIPTLKTLLAGVDARLVKDANGYRVASGAQISAPASSGNLEILPLRYIDANEFAKIVNGYQVSATVIEQGNLLALNGSSQDINQVKKLARSFDVNWLKGMSIGLFPVKNTSAETLRAELLEVFGNGLDQDLAGTLRIVAVERSNTIMVIAAQRDSVELMGDWVKRLDNVGNAAEQQFFIYRVQNGRASDLVKLLQQMFGNGPTNALNEALNNDQASDNTNGNGNRRTGDFNVIADESSNSIIVSGSPHYYQAVRKAMEQLDSTPLQVLVEARIMELTLSDDLQYGLEWFLNGSRASTDTSARLDLRGAGIGAIQPGFSYVFERAGEVRAALTGLANDSRLKVLSSPSLMVLNNRTASILVGDEVPIPTRQAVSNISPEAPTVNEIEYRNTGILLTVSPRVNSGGMVTMDISQEVSSVVDNTTSQIDAPTIQQRQLNSTVSIQSGQTVVLGGLIREQNTGRESGVPFLKNLPGVGKLFSTTNNGVQRTELIVLITPRVISGAQDSDAITDEYQQKMFGLRPIPLNQL